MNYKEYIRCRRSKLYVHWKGEQVSLYRGAVRHGHTKVIKLKSFSLIELLGTIQIQRIMQEKIIATVVFCIYRWQI